MERWAWDYVVAVDLETKFALDPPPALEWESTPPSREALRPGRDRALCVQPYALKTPGREALRDASKRAQVIHTFLHHELQAAELMCWAILAFPSTPRAFRVGLAGIARDEVRHMNMYRDHLARLGHSFGEYPVRDWFWQRVPSTQSAIEFVATMGIGFEGANLDHTVRFAERFRHAGDDEAAALQQRVGDEERPHVRFALHWFERWTGSNDFSIWASHLPRPLSPTVMRGAPVQRSERERAGFTPAFLDRLTQWRETASGY